MAHYLDTSALVKLVTAEPQTRALRTWLADTDTAFVACDLVRTELMRAVRHVAPGRATRVREVLDGLTLLTVTSVVFDAAGRLEPASLRSLDAVHLAAALTLGDDLDAVVTYDDRLAEAAARYGLAVVAPG